MFRSKLESELREADIAASYRIFQWSGGNSVRDRARAAEELSHQLASDPDNANSIVIAHSHGGNVAFLAISKLGNRGANFHLITLATPFVRVFPARHAGSFEFIGAMSFFVTLGFGLSLLHSHVPEPWNRALGLLGPSDWLADPRAFSLTPHVLSVLLFWPPLAVVSYLLAHLFLNPSPRLSQLVEQTEARASRFSKIAKLEQLAGQMKAWAWRPFNISKLANYDSTSPLAPNLLVIRGIDDEAALMLVSGSIGTAISRIAVRLLSSPKVLLFLVLCHIFRFPVHTHIADWFDQYIMQAGYFVLMSLLCVFLLTPGLFNSAFGTEFLIGAARCEIAHDSTPDSTRARIITLKTPDQQPRVQNSALSASSMHHGIYNYPSCGREIVKWIAESVR
ncbi:hypothetical protein AC629_05070 [Bradyrhizobium sp. NAS80.1]|uniref:hypothetical protein n=1 Tax=Bradyrhizobium sp. NAS80.1 TaxID=1680159 RepID=UPI000967BA77|nr:hypothetical protein [Bradyrhizobium sp. NAS80.1]OKO90157.1 hypothetical protein AC629_05070 [Bradyrhizobium sp. NAS80.1]